MNNTVPDMGPDNAKIMIVGEAVGEKEVLEGKPFAGPAGRVLDSILKEADIIREQCYITNVVQRRPEGNDFSTITKEELQMAHNRLHTTIEWVKPNVVVCLGEQALKAVLGHSGISKWRGSVDLVNGNGPKAIATFHPTTILREWHYRATAVMDFKKAHQESVFPEFRRKIRTYHIPKTAVECIRILKEINTETGYVAFDIETEANQITAIAFAPSTRPDWAVCIPIWFGDKGSFWRPEEEAVIWGEVGAILANDGLGKIAHNGAYDIEFISRTLGLPVKPFVFDTMLGMHCLYPELPKALSYAVSIYTDHPYYKGDINSPDEETFFRYNATDACLTMELATLLMQEIKEDGLWEFYQKQMHALVEPILAMQARGVKFDFLRRNSVKKRMQEEVAVLQKSLDKAVGRPLNVNSPKQMKEWLYGKREEGNLGLKIKTKTRKATGQETIAADEEALNSLFKECGNEAIQTVLKIREKQKVISTYLEVKLDDDKRIRCSYLVTGTETGRLASRATARGTGTNLQNVPPGVVRSLFLPDDGRLLINADLSQAEARVVAYLSSDARLMRIFDEGGDIHRKNASVIFGCLESSITEEQRYLAKRVVHASNYGMGPITFAKTAGIATADAKRLLNQYFASYPGIVNWHSAIRSQLQRSRRLVNPFGRTRTFFGRYDETMVREGLAFLPQSTVADIVNQALVKAHKEGLEVLLQVHDSLVIQASQEDLDAAVQKLKYCLSVPVEINGKILRIPVDVKIGPNWDELKKV